MSPKGLKKTGMPSIEYLGGLNKVTAAILREEKPKDILAVLLDSAINLTGGTSAVINLKRRELQCVAEVDDVSNIAFTLGNGVSLVSDYPEPAYGSGEGGQIKERDNEAQVIEDGSSMVLKFPYGEILLQGAKIDSEYPDEQKVFLTVLANLAAWVVRKAVDSKDMDDKVKAQDRINKKLIEKNLTLRTKTMIDELTGLHNRSFFERSLSYELERYERYRISLSIIMFDIDHFKEVNDEHGHSAGDTALRHMAKVAKNTVRTADILARYGGEEFVVLLPHTELSGARISAERLRINIAASPLVLEQNQITLTISAGVTAVCSGPSPTLDELLKITDHALYQAKNSGRNRIVVVSETHE